MGHQVLPKAAMRQGPPFPPHPAPSTQLLPTGLVDEQISCLRSSYQPPPIDAKPIELQSPDSLRPGLPSSSPHPGLKGSLGYL